MSLLQQGVARLGRVVDTAAERRCCSSWRVRCRQVSARPISELHRGDTGDGGSEAGLRPLLPTQALLAEVCLSLQRWLPIQRSQLSSLLCCRSRCLARASSRRAVESDSTPCSRGECPCVACRECP